MTPDRFRQLAETWGGDIDRWPPDTQAMARVLAATATGAAILTEARRLDRMFADTPDVDTARAGRVTLAVLQRIATSVGQHALPWYRRWSWPSLLPAASLAGSALIGIWLAQSLPYHGDQNAVAVVSMVFDSTAINLGGLQ